MKAPLTQIFPRTKSRVNQEVGVLNFYFSPPFTSLCLCSIFPKGLSYLRQTSTKSDIDIQKKGPEKKRNIVWIQKLHILHEFQILVTVLELTVALTQFHKLLAIGKILFDKTFINFVSVYNARYSFKFE